jgi:hypothetical protein
VGNPNSALTSEFQSLLYYKFTFRKEYDKNELAIFLGKAPDTVQRYCSGRLPVTADAAREIIRFIAKKNPKDTEFLEFFCLEAGFLPLPISKGKLSSEEREKDQIRLSILNGQALKEIEDAYEDGRLERLELKRIERALTRLQEKAGELKEKIAKEVKG